MKGKKWRRKVKLEELIYKRFSGAKELTKYLSIFSGCPAIFSPEAPEDNQDGWEGRAQYPRIVYNLDIQANEERKSAGTLLVSLLCQNTEKVTPEEIEVEIRKCLRDIVIKPENGILYVFTWSRTDAFTLQEKNLDFVIGSDIRFDILEYSLQETTDPDPIMAINQYIKKLYTDCLVIGFDRIEEITEATKEQPILYCQLAALEKAEETNTVAWMDSRVAVHILCPDSEKRLKMAAAIVNQMSLDGEVILLDQSPMFIKRLQVNYKSDYLKDGQIFVTGHYGLLRYKEKPHMLQGAYLEYT